jgi:hypothetical protein
MTLAAATLTESTLESGSKALLAEWLAGYFDGQAHAVWGDSVMFPECSIRFDASATRQPLLQSGSNIAAEIRVVAKPGRVTRHPDTVGTKAFAWVTLQFYVRAQVGGSGTGNSNMVADRVSELLFAVLSNPAERYALAQKGITHLVPRTPETITAKDFAMRVIHCRASYVWLVNHG